MHSPDAAFRQPDPHTDRFGMFYQLERADISLAGGETRSLARRGLPVLTRRMYRDSRRLRGPVGSRPGGDCLRVRDQLPVASKKLTWIAGRQLWSCMMTRSAAGVNHSITGSPLSYWSVSADKTGGVAILLDPRRAAAARPWHPEL